MKCEICGCETDELWADTYCQDCWENSKEAYNECLRKNKEEKC